MPMLYRAIRKDSDGLPWLSDSSAKGLGVRPIHDITPDEDGVVHPETGGTSCADDSAELPSFLGDEPVWEIASEELPAYLATRDDPDRDHHVYIEPAYSMDLEAFQDALAETRELWTECA